MMHGQKNIKSNMLV